MSNFPHVHSGAFEGPSLYTDPTGTYQVGVLIRASDKGASIHKRTLPDGGWTGHTFAGADATTLALPVPDDDHNYMACAVDGLGKIHVIGNHHAEVDELHYLESTVAGDITGWTAGTLPGLNAGFRLTYPRFVPLNDGTLLLFIRAYGGSGGGDYHYWSRGPAASVWTHHGLLWGNNATTSPDYSAYPTQMWVEAADGTNPGRLHVAWVWRSDTALPTGNTLPSYMYSDDPVAGGWTAVDGTALTPPLFPDNNAAAQTGVFPTGDIVNGGGCTVDADGRPVFTVAHTSGFQDQSLVRWDGAAWQTTNLLNLLNLRARPNLFLHRGQVHMLTVNGDGRIVVYNVDTFDVEGKFAVVPRPSSVGSWEQNYDPVALRDRGQLEFLVPDGDTPRAYRWGKQGAPFGTVQTAATVQSVQAAQAAADAAQATADVKVTEKPRSHGNLIYDPSFESGQVDADVWYMADGGVTAAGFGWVLFDANTGTPPAGIKSGRYAARFRFSTAAEQTMTGDAYLLGVGGGTGFNNRQLAVRAGDTVEAEFYAGYSNAGMTGSGVAAYLQWRDATGTVLAPTTGATSVPATFGAGRLPTRYTVSGVAPDGAVYALVGVKVFQMTSAGTTNINFDDFAARVVQPTGMRYVWGPPAAAGWPSDAAVGPMVVYVGNTEPTAVMRENVDLYIATP